MVDPQIVQIKHLAKHTPLQIHPDPKISIKINRKFVTNGGRAALYKKTERCHPYRPVQIKLS